MDGDERSEEAWVTVYRPDDGWKAAIACGWLNDADIPAVQIDPVTGLDPSTGAPGPSWSAVRVPESYRAQAEEVLKDMLPEA
jgi:hypothetical protein